MAREQQYRALMATAGSRDYDRGAATRTPGPVWAVARHVEHDQDEQGLAGDKQRQASTGGTRVYGADSTWKREGEKGAHCRCSEEGRRGLLERAGEGTRMSAGDEARQWRRWRADGAHCEAHGSR